MDISFATEKDVPEVRQIWKECFGDSDSYMNNFFAFPFKWENTIVAKCNQKCIGALQLFPHDFVINGKTHKSMYVGGVSVLPEYRRIGVCKNLMLYAEQYMLDNDVAISFLVPFSFAFYEKMGYECISYLSEFSGPVESLASFVLENKAESAINVSLKEAYTQYAKQFPLYLKRDISRYQNEILPLLENHSVYALPNDLGYIIYEIKKGTFIATEIVYKNADALRHLLWFVYSQRNNIQSFSIRTSANGFMRKLLCENEITEKRFPHAMAKKLVEITLTDSMENYINMLGWF